MECHNALAQSSTKSIRVPSIQETLNDQYYELFKPISKTNQTQIYFIRLDLYINFSLFLNFREHIKLVCRLKPHIAADLELVFHTSVRYRKHCHLHIFALIVAYCSAKLLFVFNAALLNALSPYLHFAVEQFYF